MLTTHYMDEAQYLADRICVIAAGQVVAQGTPETLRAGTDQLTHIRFELPAAWPLRSPAPGEDRRRGRDHRDGDADPDPQRADHLGGRQGLELPNLEVTRPSLEDVYLELTGNE